MLIAKVCLKEDVLNLWQLIWLVISYPFCHLPQIFLIKSTLEKLKNVSGISPTCLLNHLVIGHFEELCIINESFMPSTSTQVGLYYTYLAFSGLGVGRGFFFFRFLLVNTERWDASICDFDLCPKPRQLPQQPQPHHPIITNSESFLAIPIYSKIWIASTIRL